MAEARRCHAPLGLALLLAAGVSLPVNAVAQGFAPFGFGSAARAPAEAIALLTDEDAAICRNAAAFSRDARVFQTCMVMRANGHLRAQQAVERQVAGLVALSDRAVAAHRDRRYDEARSTCTRLLGARTGALSQETRGVDELAAAADNCHFLLGFYAEKGIGTQQDYRKALAQYAAMSGRATLAHRDRALPLRYYGAADGRPEPGALDGDITLHELASAGAMPPTLDAYERFDAAATLKLLGDSFAAHDYSAAYRAALAVAALADDPAEADQATLALGMMRIAGEGTAQDIARGVVEVRAAAVHGYAPAEATVGAMYASGGLKSVPQDHRQAAAWLTRARAHGQPELEDAIVRETGIADEEDRRERQRLADEQRRRDEEQAKLNAYAEAVLGNDSQSWAMNRYVRGSARDVRITEGTLAAGDFRLRATYTYNDDRTGWVEVAVVHRKPSCLTYWDFAGTCRAPGASNAFVAAGEVFAGLMALSVAAGIAADAADGGARSADRSYAWTSPPKREETPRIDSYTCFQAFAGNIGVMTSAGPQRSALLSGSTAAQCSMQGM